MGLSRKGFYGAEQTRGFNPPLEQKLSISKAYFFSTTFSYLHNGANLIQIYSGKFCSTTKLLLRILMRLFPLGDLEDLKDLSCWSSWETFLLRIFPLDDLEDLEDLFSWGSWENFLLRIFLLEDLEDLSFWRVIFRASRGFSFGSFNHKAA